MAPTQNAHLIEQSRRSTLLSRHSRASAVPSNLSSHSLSLRPHGSTALTGAAVGNSRRHDLSKQYISALRKGSLYRRDSLDSLDFKIHRDEVDQSKNEADKSRRKFDTLIWLATLANLILLGMWIYDVTVYVKQRHVEPTDGKDFCQIPDPFYLSEASR